MRPATPSSDPTRGQPRPLSSTLTGARGKAAVWVLLFLLVAGGAFAVWYFVLRSAGGGGASRALAARVLPGESQVTGGLDLSALTAGGDLRRILGEAGVDAAQLDKALSDLGIAPADLGGLVFGATMDGERPSSVIMALEAKADAQAIGGLIKALAAQAPPQFKELVDVDALFSAPGEGGRSVFVIGGGALFDKAKALVGGAGNTAPGAELGLLQGALGDGAIAWVAAPVPPSTFKGLSGAIATKTLGGTPSHFGASLGAGKNLVLRGAIHVPGGDADTLAGALKTMQGMFKGQAPEAVRPLLEGIAFGGRGPVVTATLELDAKALSALKTTL